MANMLGKHEPYAIGIRPCSCCTTKAQRRLLTKSARQKEKRSWKARIEQEN